jgi:hypothetical protein
MVSYLCHSDKHFFSLLAQHTWQCCNRWSGTDVSRVGESAGRHCLYSVTGKKSILASSELLVVGSILAINSIIATRYFAVWAFPGLITGMILGLAIIVLGAAKSIGTPRKVRAKNDSSQLKELRSMKLLCSPPRFFLKQLVCPCNHVIVS